MCACERHVHTCSLEEKLLLILSSLYCTLHSPPAQPQPQQTQTPGGRHRCGRGARCCHPPSPHCCSAAAACERQHSITTDSSTPQRSGPAHACGSLLNQQHSCVHCVDLGHGFNPFMACPSTVLQGQWSRQNISASLKHRQLTKLA